MMQKFDPGRVRLGVALLCVARPSHPVAPLDPALFGPEDGRA